MGRINSDMHYVKNNLRNKSALQVYMIGKVVLKRMQGNPHFPSPMPSLEQVQIYVAQLQSLLAQQETLLQLEQRNKAQQQLAKALRSLASYVASVSGGKAEIILSSGFGIRKKRSKAKVRPAPSTKRYIKLPQYGCVKLMWHADPSANTFKLYINEAGNPECHRIPEYSHKSSAVIKGLESGKKYQICVSAINSAGESGLSQPFTVYEAWLS